MNAVDAYAKVVVDDSGFQSEIPVLLTENGVVLPLLDYLLNKHIDRSLSWQRNVVIASKLLFEYMDANQHNFSDPVTLFQSFAARLFTGTVGDDGLDPSGLYWIPASTTMANRHLNALKGLTDYLADTQGVTHMNPLIAADDYDQRLNYAAWHRRNQNDFLGHIKDKTVSEAVQGARNVKGRRALSNADNDDAVAFPEKLFKQFFLEGFGGAKDRRCAVRDQLITLMMHGAGLRESEPVHLWVEDVGIDPHDPSKSVVRIYHPEDGRAPDEWKSRTGKTNRSAYLRERYALAPRNKLKGTKRAGWKVRIHDHRENFIQLHWFPTEYGQLFLKLWNEHLFYLTGTDRYHPYAFVSYEKDTFGQPYTLNAFNKNYAAAMARIGLSTAKIEGRSPHGHRHAFGRRLTRAGVDPVIRKKALHHSSLESQQVYTALGISDVSQALDLATSRLDKNPSQLQLLRPFSDWGDLMTTGFEDVDPRGLLSGPYAKLRKD